MNLNRHEKLRSLMKSSHNCDTDLGNFKSSDSAWRSWYSGEVTKSSLSQCMPASNRLSQGKACAVFVRSALFYHSSIIFSIISIMLRIDSFLCSETTCVPQVWSLHRAVFHVTRMWHGGWGSCFLPTEAAVCILVYE